LEAASLDEMALCSHQSRLIVIIAASFYCHDPLGATAK